MTTLLPIYNNCSEALCPWQTQNAYQIKAQLGPMLFLFAGKTDSSIIKTPNSIYRGLVQLSLRVGSATQKLLNSLYRKDRGAVQAQKRAGNKANQCHYGDMRQSRIVSCDIKPYFTVGYKMPLYSVIRIQYPTAHSPSNSFIIPVFLPQHQSHSLSHHPPIYQRNYFPKSYYKVKHFFGEMKMSQKTRTIQWIEGKIIEILSKRCQIISIPVN